MIRATLSGHYREDARYPAAMVNISNRCNLSCQHCFVFRDGTPNEEPASAREEMPDAAILETLAGLRDRHGIVSMLLRQRRGLRPLRRLGGLQSRGEARRGGRAPRGLQPRRAYWSGRAVMCLISRSTSALLTLVTPGSGMILPVRTSE